MNTVKLVHRMLHIEAVMDCGKAIFLQLRGSSAIVLGPIPLVATARMVLRREKTNLMRVIFRALFLGRIVGFGEVLRLSHLLAMFGPVLFRKIELWSNVGLLHHD